LYSPEEFTSLLVNKNDRQYGVLSRGGVARAMLEGCHWQASAEWRFDFPLRWFRNGKTAFLGLASRT
jgi:hypothetical protein